MRSISGLPEPAVFINFPVIAFPPFALPFFSSCSGQSVKVRLWYCAAFRRNMIWKRCPRCGKRIPEGTQCEGCKRKRDKARDRYYDKHIRNKDAKSYYASEEWRIARELALDRADGICQWTLATEGRVEAAEDVHHIIPLREDWSRRSDPGNLIALSHSSHAHIEYIYKHGEREKIQKKLFEIVKSSDS